MKPRRLALPGALLLFGSLISAEGIAQTIYCEDNKQMRCLGFSEKVVDSKAICFDPMRCSQEGFVCKSELNAMASEHNTLLNQHNELVSTHNELIDALENSKSDYDRLLRCVDRALTLDEAKGCS